MKTKLLKVCAIAISLTLVSCDEKTPVSASGVQKTTIKVPTDGSGHTSEQNNVVKRLKRDNDPGSIKHLYVISPYSGEVIYYSSVKGKVSSSGKRLTPTTATTNNTSTLHGIAFEVDGRIYYTEEMLQDDGTYGSSAEYIYWFDQNDIYHQHLVSGSAIVHIADQPIKVQRVMINMETQSSK